MRAILFPFISASRLTFLLKAISQADAFYEYPWHVVLPTRESWKMEKEEHGWKCQFIAPNRMERHTLTSSPTCHKLDTDTELPQGQSITTAFPD